MSAFVLKYSLLCFLFSLISCREEIIPPFNPGGNINEPVQQISADSYTFIINAQGISDSLIDKTPFNFTNSYLFLSLFDYLSGAVELTIYDRSRNIIYYSILNNNFPGSSSKLEGFIPDRVQIFFRNFTGKLTVQIVQDFSG
jgi:hypothetical protein